MDGLLLHSVDNAYDVIPASTIKDTNRNVPKNIQNDENINLNVSNIIIPYFLDNFDISILETFDGVLVRFTDDDVYVDVGVNGFEIFDNLEVSI